MQHVVSPDIYIKKYCGSSLVKHRLVSCSLLIFFQAGIPTIYFNQHYLLEIGKDPFQIERVNKYGKCTEQLIVYNIVGHISMHYDSLLHFL